MKDFHPYWCMLLGEQAGKRVSDRACIAIHRAIKYVAALGYNIHDLPPIGEVHQGRVFAGVRLALRNGEDDLTNAMEYTALLLHHQKNEIISRGEEREIVRWATYLERAGKLRSQYRWKLARDLLPPPSFQRGP